jgi:hypothetical protein
VADFAHDVAVALAHPLDVPLRVAVPYPAVTALVLDGGDLGRALDALGALLAVMRAAGLPPRRALGLVALAAAVPPSAHGVPLVAHDPVRSPCFRLGVTPGGLALELDDELREAEAVIVLGRADGPGGGHALVLPGLASASCAAAHRAAGGSPDEARAAARLLGVDHAVLWDAPGRVVAGGLDAAAAALAGGVP